MFGVGTLELIVIGLAAVMLFPPTELPKLLRSVSRFWGQVRATADEFKDAIMTADGVDEISDLVQGTRQQVRRVEADARRELMKARTEMRKAQQTLARTAQARDEMRTDEHDTPTAGVPRGHHDGPAPDPDATTEPGAGENNSDRPVDIEHGAA